MQLAAEQAFRLLVDGGKLKTVLILDPAQCSTDTVPIPPHFYCSIQW